jgi:hypothetical protein
MEEGLPALVEGIEESGVPRELDVLLRRQYVPLTGLDLK